MPESVSLATEAGRPTRSRWPRPGRFNLEIRQPMRAAAEALIIFAAALIGLFVSFMVLLAAGLTAEDVVDAFGETFSNMQSLRSVMQQAGPLVLMGLAAAIAFRANFWNIGLEGQVIGGAIAATAVSVYHVGPDLLRLPLMVVAAAMGGALWSAPPAILKLRLNVNEIISTLLLNYVAADFLFYLLFGAWSDPADHFPHSRHFAPSEQFPDVVAGMSADVLFASALVALVFWLTHFSRIGTYISFISSNNRMARAMGIRSVAVTAMAVGISGALAGLGGLFLIGQEGRLTENFYSGYGFSGVLIAFLGRNNPIAICLVAVLVAVLFDAGRTLQVFNQIPFAMVQLIQAIVVMSVAASEFVIRYRVRWIRATP